MDSTTLVLPGHVATVHPSGSLLITPEGWSAAQQNDKNPAEKTEEA